MRMLTWQALSISLWLSVPLHYDQLEPAGRSSFMLQVRSLCGQYVATFRALLRRCARPSICSLFGQMVTHLALSSKRLTPDIARHVI